MIFCRGQIGLKFVGPSACRTLADFLSRLTSLRLGAGSFKIKMCRFHSRDSDDISKLVESARDRRQIVLVHHTLADKARQDVLRSSTVRFRPTSPDLVADLSEFTAHYPTSEDFLSADKKSASVRRPLSKQITGYNTTQPLELSKERKRNCI